MPILTRYCCAKHRFAEILKFMSFWRVMLVLLLIPSIFNLAFIIKIKLNEFSVHKSITYSCCSNLTHAPREFVSLAKSLTQYFTDNVTVYVTSTIWVGECVWGVWRKEKKKRIRFIKEEKECCELFYCINISLICKHASVDWDWRTKITLQNRVMFGS